MTTRTYVVVGEDGGSTKLAGDPAMSAPAAAEKLRQQSRRGYLAVLDGDQRTGKLTAIQPLNEPTVDFDEVARRFAARASGRGSSNTLFRGVGGVR